MTTQRRWPDAFVPRVRLLGEVFANALLRQQADRRVRAAQAETAHYQERLAHLIRVHTVGEMSAAIARALETSWPSAQRLENPRHSPTLRQLEKAAALGKRLVLALE